MIDRGADPNYKSNLYRFKPLHYAISNNDPKMVDLLLKSGTSIKRYDEYEREIACSRAIKTGNLKILQLLFDSGLEIDPHSEYFFQIQDKIIDKIVDRDINTIELILKQDSKLASIKIESYYNDRSYNSFAEVAEDRSNATMLNLIKSYQKQ